VASVSGQQEDEGVLRGVKEGQYQLVLFTPEMLLQSSKWRAVLGSEVYSQNLKALAIDEAHS
jgi:superfamily II DNA helicase RecQ